MFLCDIGRIKLHGCEVSEKFVEAVLDHVIERLDVVGRGQG